MKPRTSGMHGARESKGYYREGPNWVFIAGGALLSTLSIRLGYKLKRVLDARKPENTCHDVKERKKSGNCNSPPNWYCCAQNEGNCFNYMSGNQCNVEIKQQQNGQLMTEPDMALPLVTVPATEYNKDNGVMWSSSPERLELPQKPLHHSNSFDSPCVSESGSDVFSKREVIHKLRLQLKRRDDMILEMQDQIVELQNSVSTQVSHSSHLQSLLDAANRDLLDSEREIQRLRKAIADHCVGQVGPNNQPSTVQMRPSEGRCGHANGYLAGESRLEFPEKGRGDEDRIEVLKKEVTELKEVIEGKKYLLQSYKEQNVELSMKIKELQQRLDSQVPNIL
ncbi:hypothetical protein NMG60_11007083 [Bertholletia excelsa]